MAAFVPVTSVPEAVEAMVAIGARLPATDGVSAFNRMYLQVTEAVGSAIRDGVFANSAFLDRLDVVFANHYLSAVAAAEAGLAIPDCWQVLWEHRAAPDRAPIQFAIAGMNAHINHDLVIALVETFAELGGSPRDETMHADYVRVNALLASLEGGIRRSYEHGIALELDEHFAAVENCVDTWTISRARGAAWDDAVTLWHVRTHDTVRSRYERLLDRATALASRCLLMPSGRHDHEAQPACMAQAPALAGATPA